MGEWFKDSRLQTSVERLSGRAVASLSQGAVQHLVDGALVRRGSKEKNDSYSSTLSIAISLGIAIPVIVAAAVFYWLHRRNKRILKLEDANDKHGSLDFGLGEVRRKKANQKNQEMSFSDTEKMLRHANRGVSVDMGSPYVLPGELEESRPSFHSLSRSAHDSEDPYRPVAFAKSPIASRSTSRRGSMSLKTASSTTSPPGSRPVRSSSKPGPQSITPSTEYLLPTSPSDPSPVEKPEPVKTVARKPVKQSAATTQEVYEMPADDEHTRNGPNFVQEQDNSYPLLELPQTTEFSIPALPTFNLPDEPQPDQDQRRSNRTFASSQRSSTPPVPDRSPARGDFGPPAEDHGRTPVYSTGPFDPYATYADVLGIAQSDSYPLANEYPDQHLQPQDSRYSNAGLGVTGLDVDSHRISMSLRPLPPDDPTDNPEQRANRIRSFYREYFDDHKQREDDYGFTDYYEDYGQEYMEAPTFFDQDSGQFIVPTAPYAEPVTRRAMTPPPRAPPRFRSNGPQHPRHGSMGGYPNPGYRSQRAYSSASGRMPPGPAYRGRPAAKPMPPPAPLSNLPTPHLLKDDKAIFSAIEFAPPQSAKERQAGRPDSPFAEKRPYSPSVRAFTPLASSYDDLAVMPSPHLLRKSGTFTALDFAPPPRLMAEASGSDSGSIRSGRSGRSNLSASQVANIRAGAYRLSRIPAGVVGTKDDFTASLRPKWNQREALI